MEFTNTKYFWEDNKIIASVEIYRNGEIEINIHTDNVDYDYNYSELSQYIAEEVTKLLDTDDIMDIISIRSYVEYAGNHCVSIETDDFKIIVH